MPKQLAHVLAWITAFAVTGCGTALNLSGEPCVYGGVRMDAAGISCLAPVLGGAQPEPCPKLSRADCLVIGACALADLPFSAVADTLTLPYTVRCAVARPSEETLTPAEPSAK